MRWSQGLRCLRRETSEANRKDKETKASVLASKLLDNTGLIRNLQQSEVTVALDLNDPPSGRERRLHAARAASTPAW